MENKIRFFFTTRELPDVDGNYKSFPAFVDLSVDGEFQIQRIAQDPIMKLGAIGSFDEFGIYPFCPIRVGEETFGVYAGWTRCTSVPFDVSLGIARANTDCTRFEKHGPGPILSKSLNEPFVVSSPKVRFYNGKYFLFYIAGSRWFKFDDGKMDVHYRIRMAVSDDLVNWKRIDRDLIRPVIEGIESQASPDVFKVGNIYFMIFCYRKVGYFGNKSRGYKLGLAYSRNLFDWERCDNDLILNFSPSYWDNESQNYPHVFETNTGKFYLAYTGNGIGASGMGIAELSF